MEDLRINERITIPASDLNIQQVRSSGPGGQNVNKVASKIVLTWAMNSELLGNPAVEMRLRKLAGQRLTKENQIQIIAQESRSADRNLQMARRRLRDLILAAFVKPKPRVPTKPSRGAVRRRLETKSKTGEKKSSRQQNWDG